MSNTIKYVISKSLYLKLVCIHDSAMTVHRSKIKARLALFDEVFYYASLTVKLDKILRWRIHICNKKCVRANHSIFCFFNPTYKFVFHMAKKSPDTGIHHKLQHNSLYCPSWFHKVHPQVKIFYTNHIFYAIFFTLLIQRSVAKTLSPQSKSLIPR